MMSRSKFSACILTLTLAGAPATLFGGDAEKGKEAFEQCAVCHNADSTDKKLGPGLKDLFKKDKMENGEAPTDENVNKIINEGGNGMPAYEELLSAEERADLLAYLKIL